MSHKRKVLQGSASNMLRLLLSTLVSFLLPPFLVHHLSQAEYSAWVLILQLSAYVIWLDLGLQTAIGKFVAEYDAAGSLEDNRLLVSTSFSMLAVAALLGSAAIGVFAWLAPRLFHQMPAALVPEVRFGLLAVGLSTAFALPFNIFPAIFTGLQQYVFPTVVAVVGRISNALALIAILLLKGSLLQMAFAIAGLNVAIACSQYWGWRRYARQRVGFSLLLFERKAALRLGKYGGVVSLWTLSGLFVSGLDTLIVGHFDYVNTGFYAIAASATNFMLLIVGSVFGPLLPAISSIQAGRTPGQIGELSIKATRYCGLLLCLLGLPLLFCASQLLALWVGATYAARSARFLQVLVLGNIVRQLGYPYALAVLATGKQHLATVSAVAEAIVNFALSLWLAQRIGAIGVAVGTLAGSFVSLGIHIAVSMHYTRSAIQIQRWRFALQGLLRPLLCVVPSLLLYPFWRRSYMLPTHPALLAAWFAATAATAWMAGLNPEERKQFRGALFRLVY